MLFPKRNPSLKPPLPPDTLELPVLNASPQNGQQPLQHQQLQLQQFDRKASSISVVHTKRSPTQEKRRSLPAYKYSKTRVRSFESEGGCVLKKNESEKRKIIINIFCRVKKIIFLILKVATATGKFNPF